MDTATNTASRKVAQRYYADNGGIESASEADNRSLTNHTVILRRILRSWSTSSLGSDL